MTEQGSARSQTLAAETLGMYSGYWSKSVRTDTASSSVPWMSPTAS